jgi:hypothetical protein
MPNDSMYASAGLPTRCGAGLRAGDALHLAIASNHGAGTFYSLDRSMVKLRAESEARNPRSGPAVRTCDSLQGRDED